jgi:hypothetical protein
MEDGILNQVLDKLEQLLRDLFQGLSWRRALYREMHKHFHQFRALKGNLKIFDRDIVTVRARLGARSVASFYEIHLSFNQAGVTLHGCFGPAPEAAT